MGVSFRKKSIIYGGCFSFFGCGLVCGGVSLGAVVGWGWGSCRVDGFRAVFLPWRSPVLGVWASAGVGAGGAVVGWGWGSCRGVCCGGGPVVVGLFSTKFEKWVVCEKDWPRGYQSGLHFWTSPPPYVCISYRGWRGWAVGWAGVV